MSRSAQLTLPATVDDPSFVEGILAEATGAAAPSRRTVGWMRPIALALFALVLAAVLCTQTAAGTPAPAVVVAVVDSGVTPNTGLKGHVLTGWDFVDNDAKAADENGHGTELASIVQAQCPRCMILPVRVLGRSGLGSADLAIAGIHWAVAHGARVINLSMTTPSDNPDLTAAVEWAVAQGVTTVLAAGNNGAPFGYPAASAPSAIAVASVDASGRLYSWSNYGPWVNMLAPGALSARSLQGKPVNAVGTSASAAYVSGRAGRLLACEPMLSPAEVRTALAAPQLSAAC